MENNMSEKHPNEDYEKYQEKSVPSEHSDHSIHREYQKLDQKIENLDQKIDKFLKKMSDMKDEHPYEDYKKFETSTKVPSYFKELVSVFEPLKTREIEKTQNHQINISFKDLKCEHSHDHPHSRRQVRYEKLKTHIDNLLVERVIII